MTKLEVPARVAALLDRPVRWAQPIFAYDGCETTLQVFNAEMSEQDGMLMRLEPHRAELEAAAGGPLVVMFFTRKQSARHATFVAEFEASRD
jgi:hypothetical protein